MSFTRWHASPLAGTVGVLAALAFLAIPLRELTGRPRAGASSGSVSTGAEENMTPAVLRLKLLDPVGKLVIRGADGGLLLESGPMPAGESEHDVRIPLADGVCELVLTAGTGDGETAVFLTVMPDGLPDETRYMTGSGTLDETLRFEWHMH